MSLRTYRTPPKNPSGYYLENGEGWFSVLVPAGMVTTLNTNPSFERNNTGYTAVNLSGGVVRSSDRASRGLWSGKLTPSSTALAGAYMALTTTTGQPYSISLDLYDDTGRWFDLYFADSSGNRISRVASVRGANYWQRVFVNFSEYAGGSRRIYIARRAGGSTAPFYIDGVMVLNKSERFAYYDGDRSGFLVGQNAFYWSGPPHASTSVMVSNTANGGIEVNLLDLGFRLLAVMGLGLAPFIARSTPIASGGAHYQDSVVGERSFALVGEITDSAPEQVERIIARLGQIFHPVSRLATGQPLVLRYHRVNPSTGQETAVVDIPAVYQGGLEGVINNRHGQQVELAFRQYFPMFYGDAEQSATLTEAQTVTLNDHWFIQQNLDTKQWTALDLGHDETCITQDWWPSPDGTELWGVGLIRSTGVWAIYDWNGSSVSRRTITLSGATDPSIFGAVSDNTALYVAGRFTTINGTSANYIAKTTNGGSSWTAVGNPGAAVNAIGLYNGKVVVYVPNANPAVHEGYIRMWDGSAWTTIGTLTEVGTGYSASVIQQAPNGALFVSGLFGAVNGVAANSIAYYDGTNWHPLGGGLTNSSGYPALSYFNYDNNGTIYVSGPNIAYAGGQPASDVVAWIGSGWVNVLDVAYRSGASITLYPPQRIGDDLFVSGAFDLANGIPSEPQIRIRNGVVFPSDFIATDYFELYQGVRLGNNHVIAFDYDAGTSLTMPSVTTVTNTSARSYPVITFTTANTSTQKISFIRNDTTGQAIYFNNLVPLSGEILTFDTEPTRRSFTSNLRGPMDGYILAGSSTDFYLEPGTNNIALLIQAAAGSTTTTLRWQTTYNMLFEAVR